MSLNQNSTFQQIIDTINSLPVNPRPGATGNAQPADVLAGKTFSNIDNNDLVGTMPNRTGHVNAQSSSVSGTTLRFRPQAGYYDGTTGNSVQLSNANFVAGNIKQGVNLFGVTGTFDSADNLAQVAEQGSRTIPFTINTGLSKINVLFLTFGLGTQNNTIVAIYLNGVKQTGHHDLTISFNGGSFTVTSPSITGSNIYGWRCYGT